MKRFLILLAACVLISGAATALFAAAAPKEVTLWTLDFEPFYNTQTQIADAYNKANPGEKVTVEKVADYWNKAAAAIASDTTADIVYWMSMSMYPYFVGGKFLPVPKNKAYMEATYYPIVLEWWKYKDQYYGIPDDYNYEGITTLMINLSLCKEKGVQIPQAWLTNSQGPKTVQELFDFAKKITVKDKNGKIQISGLAGLNDESIGQRFLAFLLNTGEKCYDETTRKVIFNTPAGKRAIQFFTKNLKEGGFDDFNLGIGYDQFTVNGTAFMCLGAAHWGPKLLGEKPNMDWVMLHFPPPAGTKPNFFVNGGWGYTVAKTTKNASLAWKVVDFFSNKQNALKVESISGMISPRKDLATAPEFVVNQPMVRYFKVAYDDLPYGKTLPPFTMDLGFIIDTINQDVQKVMTGSMTEDAALVDMESTINTMIADKWKVFAK